ncbi:TnsA-like heteromeric transposase endonuclease subunit [Kitasatospora sp. NPDC057500]|uniref:TnsA-like heteromeric transposase endonuclease subunit n=1 Tax=Kitasatospora sp. NPDC057500 TaxID=3346151 RepID=UPI0036C249DF
MGRERGKPSVRACVAGWLRTVSGVDGWAGSGGSADVDGRAGFEAVFLDPVGQEVRQRWEDACVTVAFEDLDPVSAFPVPPGRRWGPGLWWSATTGRHVVAGSNAMRTRLTVLDRDPQVTGLAGRPVRLVWRDGRGRVRSWVPQLFARYADGTALLADCPSHAEAGGERAQRAGAVVAAACEEIGWRYRRLEPLEPVLAANLKWLAGYRHPRNRGPAGLMAAVLAAFARPRPLIEGATAVGSPVEVSARALSRPVARLAECVVGQTPARAGLRRAGRCSRRAQGLRVRAGRQPPGSGVRRRWCVGGAARGRPGPG